MLDSISFFRIIKTGFVNFWRNLWLSVAATMVMSVTLVIFATLFLLFVLTNYSIKTIQDTVDISVYFKIGLQEQQITSIQNQIKLDPKVKEVTYISAEKAFEQFKLKHQNNSDILGSLNELTENPLPATLHVKTYELSDYPEVVKTLEKEEYKEFIDSVSYKNDPQTEVVIARLDKISNLIITGGLGLVIIFSIIAILVIFNTITLTIYNRKEEVEIMRLVGATNWYIRGPFLTESLLYSIFSAAITAGLMVPVFTTILPRVVEFVNPQINVYNQNVFSYWYLVLMLFVLALLIAITSTMLAIRKYLKT
jgi:cell division transport system permease protein